MKTSKIFVLLIMLALITIAFVACGQDQPPAQPGGEPAVQQVTIRFANMNAEASWQGQAMNMFKNMVESRTDNVNIELFFAGVLGNEGELAESISAGIVDMIAIGAGISVHIPNASIMEAPFVFHDFACAHRILHDPRFTTLHQRGAAEANIVVLGYNPFGYRVVMGDRPVHSMADFHGYRLRIPNIPLWLHVWEALGANFVALPLSELIPALEQGVIDGEDATVNNAITMGSYELSSYLIKTNHVKAFQMWMLNSNTYYSMTPEDRRIVRESADAAIQWLWEIVEAGQYDDFAYLESVGYTIITPSPEFRAEMQQATIPVLEWFETVAPDGREILDVIEMIKREHGN